LAVVYLLQQFDFNFDPNHKIVQLKLISFAMLSTIWEKIIRRLGTGTMIG
jgi:hypothetical protein